MCFFSCPLDRSMPIPRPSTPALLLMVVRFLTPLRTSARIRFSGFPHRPKPPTIMVAPSNTSWIASSAFATTLFIAGGILTDSAKIHHGGAETRRKSDQCVFHFCDLDCFCGSDGLLFLNSCA